MRGRLLLVSLAVASPASAAIVAPEGFTDTISGTTVAARPELAGIVIADILTPYSIFITDENQGATGVVQSRVVRSATGTLDFYWRIIPDARSQLDMTIFSVMS